jgi:hypothetical protein
MPATPSAWPPVAPRTPPQITACARPPFHSLTRSLPFSFLRKNPSGQTARRSELRLRRRVPATPVHRSSIARARSSATLFPPPNERHHPLARSGRAQFLRPAAPPRTEPPRSRSGHRRLRSSPSLSNYTLMFTVSPRWCCAPRLVRSSPETAAGRRRPSHRRGGEHPRGRARCPARLRVRRVAGPAGLNGTRPVFVTPARVSGLSRPGRLPLLMSARFKIKIQFLFSQLEIKCLAIIWVIKCAPKKL